MTTLQYRIEYPEKWPKENPNSQNKVMHRICKHWVFVYHPDENQLLLFLQRLSASNLLPHLYLIENNQAVQSIHWTLSKSEYIRKQNADPLFFQQRFHSSYYEKLISVKTIIEQLILENTESTNDSYIDLLELESLYDKKVIHLSTGEWLRLSIFLKIIQKPHVLILKNGLAGLDVDWQKRIFTFFENDKVELPLFILPMDRFNEQIDDNKVIQLTSPKIDKSLTSSPIKFPKSLFPILSSEDRQPLIQLNKVTIQYSGVKILNQIEWTVYPGQRWRIIGVNGSGKSTLLSTIYGDIPQAYSQSILLFGQPKSQHSIWDIKSKISYFSSDYFSYYHSSKTAIETLYDQIRTPYQSIPLPSFDDVREIAQIFGLANKLKDRFQALRNAERRQLLLLGIYLKPTQIMILDEPYQEFDYHRTQLNNQFLDHIVSRTGRTLIFVSHLDQNLPKGISHTLTLTKN